MDYYTKGDLDDLIHGSEMPLIDAGVVYPALICLPKEVVDRLVKEVAIFVLKRSGQADFVCSGYHSVMIKGELDVILIGDRGGVVENAQRTMLHEIAHWWLNHLNKDNPKSDEKEEEKAADRQTLDWVNEYVKFYDGLQQGVAEYDYAPMYRLQKLTDTHFTLRWEL